jgi:hypothetical protein
MRLYTHGDPTVTVGPPPAEVLTYDGAHGRLRKLNGRASGYPCALCGSAAAEWAYDHSDPDELTDQRGRPYSLDAGRYMALCLPCHRRLDR